MNSCTQTITKSKPVKFPYIPQELLVEILLRLPFESILSFKLLSKQLKNLINDPKFYELYHNNSVALQFGSDHLYCLITRHTINSTNDQFPPYTTHRIPIGLQPSNFGYLDYKLFSGSSNTIACVKTPTHHYRFYNLFTRASYTVQGSPVQEETLVSSRICYGFGYDRYEDDYKILEVYISYDKSLRDDTDRFWVCNFKNRCWKSFHGYPNGLYYGPKWNGACSINGVLHWVVDKRDIVPTRVVLTCDLLGEIALPNGGSKIVWEGKYGMERLSELDGRLCYVYHTYTNVCVWVMQEYGVRESWTKLFAFDVNRLSIIGGRFLLATPTILYERGDGGKVVLLTRHAGSPRMFWYDIDKKEIEDVQLNIF